MADLGERHSCYPTKGSDRSQYTHTIQIYKTCGALWRASLNSRAANKLFTSPCCQCDRTVPHYVSRDRPVWANMNGTLITRMDSRVAHSSVKPNTCSHRSRREILCLPCNYKDTGAAYKTSEHPTKNMATKSAVQKQFASPGATGLAWKDMLIYQLNSTVAHFFTWNNNVNRRGHSKKWKLFKAINRHLSGGERHSQNSPVTNPE